MANPVFEVVRTAMAVREYQDKPVPEDLVVRVSEAGRLTASGANRQPWHFVVVRERANLRALGSLVRTGPYIAMAAFAIVVGYEKDSPYGVSDASRAIQSMILTAWAEGVSSNWAGFGGLQAVREKLGLPDRYECSPSSPLATRRGPSRA
jgi:nitroreductase